jgi:hypothetical protein
MADARFLLGRAKRTLAVNSESEADKVRLLLLGSGVVGFCLTHLLLCTGMTHTQYITIPASAADKLAELGRAMLQLSEGMRLSAHAATRVRPKHIPKDQAWFWTDEWQAGEREVDEALARGEYKTFNSVEEMLADLHARV